METLKNIYNFVVLYITNGGVWWPTKPKFSASNLSWMENSDNTFVKFATEILNRTKINKEIDVKTFDPMTIWMIIQIIYQIIKCYINKKMNPKTAIGMVNEPNLLHRAMLKRLMNKAIRTNNRLIGSQSSQKAFKDELYKQLLEFGKNGTVSDLEKLEASLPEMEKKINV